jgi:hypothetical protein
MTGFRQRLWRVLTRKQFSWLSVMTGLIAVLFAQHYPWQTWAVIGCVYVVLYFHDGLSALRRVLSHEKRA